MWKSAGELLAFPSCSYSRDFFSYLFLSVARQDLHMFGGVLRQAMQMSGEGGNSEYYVLGQTKSQIPRIIWDAGISGGHLIQSLTQADLTRSGCSGPCPAESWMSPRIVISLTSLDPWSNIWLPSWWKCSLLISNQNFLCSKLCLLPLLLQQRTFKKSLAFFAVPFTEVAEDSSKISP